MTIRGAAKWMERCLWVIGFLVLTVWFAVWWNARRQQANGNRELDRRLEAARQVESGSMPAARLAEGDVIGRIEIPRLEVSTVVFEGTTDDVLGIGVGHLPNSPLPGQRGNIVLAAHRDTFFRPLRDIRARDTIALVTPAGTRRYIVEETKIVTPDHVEVLGPSSGASLTLVTCYPFEWLGHAPQRFIVRAHESGMPAISSDEKAPTPAAAAGVMASVDHAPSRRREKPAARRVEPGISDSAMEPVEEVSLPAKNPGNRVVRGVKKLNPKRLWARIAAR